MDRNDRTSAAPIELYDSDIVVIERIEAEMNRKAKERGIFVRGDYHRELEERFNDAGFEVSIQWFTAVDIATGRVIPNTLIPQCSIVGRIDKNFAFDPLQMRHEVVHGLLDGEEGTVNVSHQDIAQHAHKHSH